MQHEGHCGCSANQDHSQLVEASIASTAAEPAAKVKEAIWKQKVARLKSYICAFERPKVCIVDVPVVVTINVTFHHAEASFVFIITPEPWDMLLDLAAERAEGGHVSVSSVCISSGAPQSTALRKLSALESAKLVERYFHGKDRRRVCIRLTEQAAEMVASALRDELAVYHSLMPAR